MAKHFSKKYGNKGCLDTGLSFIIFYVLMSLYSIILMFYYLIYLLQANEQYIMISMFLLMI